MSEAFCATEGYGVALFGIDDEMLRRLARFDKAGGTPPLQDHDRRIGWRPRDKQRRPRVNPSTCGGVVNALGSLFLMGLHHG